MHLPHNLPYKILEMVRASDFRGILDWSYTKGGLTAKECHHPPPKLGRTGPRSGL
jgi:hypothetical protein